jgi:hypothetical protein
MARNDSPTAAKVLHPPPRSPPPPPNVVAAATITFAAFDIMVAAHRRSSACPLFGQDRKMITGFDPNRTVIAMRVELATSEPSRELISHDFAIIGRAFR